MALAAALIAAVLLGVAAPAATAEICPASTVFDLYVADPQGNAISDGNKAERWEILTFAWSICPDTGVHDNFGNNRWGDYQFQRGISDQPTGGFHWNVWSDAGDNKSYWVPINDGVSPPPPPPPPSGSTISIWNPNAGATVYGTITVSGVYSNASAVDVQVDGGPWMTAGRTATTWSMQLNTLSYPDGAHTLRARALCVGCTDAFASRSVTTANLPVLFPDLYAGEGSGAGGEVYDMSIDEARQYLTLPLFFGTGGNPQHRCWKNLPSDTNPNNDIYRHRGVWPYFREVRQYGRWCAVYNQRIVASKVWSDQNSGPACSPNSENNFVVAGGSGSYSVTWQSKRTFNCQLPSPIPWFSSFSSTQWAEGRYNSSGTSYQVRGGGV